MIRDNDKIIYNIFYKNKISIIIINKQFIFINYQTSPNKLYFIFLFLRDLEDNFGLLYKLNNKEIIKNKYFPFI